MNKKELLQRLDAASARLFSSSFTGLTDKQAYKVACTMLREMLAEKRKEYKDSFQAKGQKQVYYLSMEFLVGTSLRNNLYNLGIEEMFRGVLKEHGFDADKIYELDPDAGLGNGGLGRLASCYLDSLTGNELPAIGFSIRYEFGIFKQKIIDGWQIEFPDNWLEMGEVWLQDRNDESYEVKFGGKVSEWYDNDQFRIAQTEYQSVTAVPYDMYISGYGSKAVNKLVLWSAKLPSFDMSAFSRGEYVRSLEQNTMAEVISKVLYPSDNHIEGKRLRLRQQYLLVSASLQSILQRHMKKHGTLDNLPDFVAVHINDTHPALCVPELMRLLMDEYGYGWDAAWDIAQRTLSYTNHTVMSEALERWSVGLFEEQLPRVYLIVKEIDRRLRERLWQIYPNDYGKINYMAVIGDGEVRMANLCLACCHMINGVSKLHTDILTTTIFKDYYNADPSRFCNVTNGIAYRRWLCQSNPALTDYLKTLIGKEFLKDANALEKLLAFENDSSVLQELDRIKRRNKARLAAYIAENNGVNVDPDSIFDVQVKRLHEYKRQLLNILHVLYIYRYLRDNPNADYPPRTFIFAAKASTGYDLAKQIISLIVAVSERVNSDPLTRDKLKVVFIEDYRVSLAEIIIPAAEISEQISVAGKEASGTSNMKLMINGAVTLGTMDGANVEICEQVGKDNMFIFGMDVEQANELWRKGYRQQEYLDADPALQEVINMLTSGELGRQFDGVAASLLTRKYGAADQYMTLADFADYKRAQRDISDAYGDKEKFLRMSLHNIAKAGVFSADRSVLEYAERIWKMI
ncbi:MAG: glycogen/starch/alpha-glucan phosphorylase [Oscillospiraceae bacterium]|nr:glycogen/starch/alpha-glucan phosphorylase [Oscillospiraceae bacterium]